MLVAGGTDLLPNMKRRQQVPRTLVSLRRVVELKEITNGNGLALGAGLTLSALVRESRIRERYAALWQAASSVATPHLRNMGTLGGNLCLDTRCNYYDQNYEWRKAIDFCMKKDGAICWVANRKSQVPGGVVHRYRPCAAGARRNGGAHQRRRYPRDRRQRPLSERWNRLPDAKTERDSDQRPPASSRRAGAAPTGS
jgi:hypothetical protein